MGITKDKLFGAIADLVEALLEYGCDHDSLIHTLTHYGFTKEQLKEWYGIGNTTSEKCDCLYCGEKSDSVDPRVLCKDCRETFGHTFFEEL
jgi:hypothetical protein